MLQAIITAALSVTAIGILCAVMLVVAAKFMSVPENGRQKAIRDCLPGANCGACGYTGCDGYAKALADEEGIGVNLCIPGSDAVSRQIADILGVEAGEVVEMVATVRCQGNCVNTTKKAEYTGILSCKAAKMIYGGENLCTYGCLGYGDCLSVCSEGAVCITDGIAHIDTRRCIGCGLCAKKCPNGVIQLMPDVRRVVVSCENKEKGASARAKCKNACIGCKKCEKGCEAGAIKVEGNLASIDYSKCNNCGKCAQSCPVGCIKAADYSGKHNISA